MEYKLLISEDANKDIENIIDYIMFSLKSPIAATGLLNEIEERYKAVVENPAIYSYCNDERLRKEEYRRIVVKNYVIIYRVDETNKVVYIVRVFYGRQNYMDLV